MTKFSVPKQPKDLIPTGTYVARCYSFVDIGTQTPKNPTYGAKRKAIATFEIPSLKKVFNEEKGEQPRVINKRYTLSLYYNPKTKKGSAFYIDLNSWIGYTEKDEDSFDPQKDILGVPCIINVGHSECGNFENILAINPLMEGQECEEQHNPTKYFFMGTENKKEDFDEEAFSKLYEWEQKLITETMEYKMTHIEMAEDGTFDPMADDEPEEKKSLK